MSSGTGRGSPLKRVLSEPTVGFVLVAAGLFGASWAFGSAGDERIEIDRADLAWRIEQAEAARGAPLPEEIRRQVERAYIDEQILVREALEMGLEDDSRIHDILAQKMLHVLSGDVIQPSEDELTEYYRGNLERYTPSPAIAVDEVVVPHDAPDPTALPSALEQGTPPEDLLGDVLITHRVMSSLTRAEVSQLFDEETSDAAFAAEPGTWVGPHGSVRGRHWLRVNARSEPGPLPLDQVREQVRLDWIAEREEAMLEERLEELRGEYEIELVGGDS